MIIVFNFHFMQLASVVLKQYVQAHWSSISEKFTPPETSSKVSILSSEIVSVVIRPKIAMVQL